jgi:hypothetical protein
MLWHLSITYTSYWMCKCGYPFPFVNYCGQPGQIKNKIDGVDALVASKGFSQMVPSHG